MKIKPLGEKMKALINESANVKNVGIRLTRAEYQTLVNICNTDYKGIVAPSRLAATMVKNALRSIQ